MDAIRTKVRSAIIPEGMTNWRIAGTGLARYLSGYRECCWQIYCLLLGFLTAFAELLKAQAIFLIQAVANRLNGSQHLKTLSALPARLACFPAANPDSGTAMEITIQSLKPCGSCLGSGRNGRLMNISFPTYLNCIRRRAAGMFTAMVVQSAGFDLSQNLQNEKIAAIEFSQIQRAIKTILSAVIPHRALLEKA